MTKLEIIENRAKNTKLELSAGILALIVSLIFIFSNHIGQFYQIYYVMLVFAFHQIIQTIIFNKWNLDAQFNRKKIGWRILIMIIVLLVAFKDLGRIDSHYSYYLGFTSGKRENTFLSILIYCGIYFIIYIFGLNRMNKKPK